MNRKLTTIDLKGTFFEVDAYWEILCQKDDRKNRIPFHSFEREGDGYRLLFDTVLKNIPENRETVVQDPDRYCWVIIPALMELDPEGIALRYDIPMEVLCPNRENIIPTEIKAVIVPLQLSKEKKHKK